MEQIDVYLKHMKNPKIGKKVYPKDNSYIECLTGDDDTQLAGVECVVVKEAFNKTIKSPITQTMKEYSFVIVEYNNQLYRVLNIFYDDNIEMLKTLRTRTIIDYI